MTVYVVESGRRDWATILEAVFLTAEEAEQYRSELRTVEGGPDERSNYHPVRAVPVGRPGGMRLATEFLSVIAMHTGEITHETPRQVMADDSPDGPEDPEWPKYVPPTIPGLMRRFCSTVSQAAADDYARRMRAKWMKYHGYA